MQNERLTSSLADAGSVIMWHRGVFVVLLGVRKKTSFMCFLWKRTISDLKHRVWKMYVVWWMMHVAKCGLVLSLSLLLSPLITDHLIHKDNVSNLHHTTRRRRTCRTLWNDRSTADAARPFSGNFPFLPFFFFSAEN